MKKAILAATAAMVALGMAPSANATVIEGIQLASNDVFDHLEAESHAVGEQTDVFHFSLDVASVFTTALLSSISNSAGDIDFLSVDLDGVHDFIILNDVNLFANGPGPFSYAGIQGIFLAAGAHVLTVKYDATATKVTYSGDVAIVPVPEPTTWAMMVAGIAAVGVTLRRRAQTTRVAFS